MTTANTLQTELDSFRLGWEARVGETIARMIAGDIDDLRATGILDRAAKAGDLLPATANLLDQHGHAFDLAALAAEKPLVVTFYRGGWCPYCNLELRAYQAILAAIHAEGAELVAVSPELPDHALTTVEKNDIAYTVLSDAGGELASALGIRFTLSDTVKPFYERAGHDLRGRTRRPDHRRLRRAGLPQAPRPPRGAGRAPGHRGPRRRLIEPGRPGGGPAPPSNPRKHRHDQDRHRRLFQARRRRKIRRLPRDDVRG
jgi:peroxiredoxin